MGSVLIVQMIKEVKMIQERTFRTLCMASGQIVQMIQEVKMILERTL